MDKARGHDFAFDGALGRDVFSPNRKRVARLSFTYEQRIVVSIMILDAAGNSLCTAKIADLPGARSVLDGAIGKLKWASDSAVQVLHRNGRDFWEVDPETGTTEFRFERAERGDPHGQYDLGVMYRDGGLLSIDATKARYWFSLDAEQGDQRAIKALSRMDDTR
jgi:TPR repeat protein